MATNPNSYSFRIMFITIIVRLFLSFAESMDENMRKWPQTEIGSQTGAFTLHKRSPRKV